MTTTTAKRKITTRQNDHPTKATAQSLGTRGGGAGTSSNTAARAGYSVSPGRRLDHATAGIGNYPNQLRLPRRTCGDGNECARRVLGQDVRCSERVNMTSARLHTARNKQAGTLNS